jgi:IS5 family transposase
MFKIVILQQLHNLSDDRMEYQINDRLSFQRFLGLSTDSKVPDAKTIWLFKEEITKKGQAARLFERFHEELKQVGLITHEGSIVDATVIEVPRQTKGNKDEDATWTKKWNEAYYGYKNNVKVDASSKLIAKFTVTTAKVHDSKEISKLIDKDDKEIYADKGYAGKKIEEEIKKINENCVIQIHQKAYRNKPLSDKEKEENKVKTKIRSRVEHVFGHMKQSMNGLFIRCKGLARATTVIMLKNLAYNLQRSAFLSYNCAQIV